MKFDPDRIDFTKIFRQALGFLNTERTTPVKFTAREHLPKPRSVSKAKKARRKMVEVSRRRNRTRH
jgi:hypothetical protein